ncbi:cytochrome c [Ciceribacter sp. L1K23]|uniref:c-type cytochrome n=1 Tax=unclassified Ciceribacter TaxID=2628820 RepID=UPI001ABE51DC|nr:MULTISPECIES: cytochrome c [unclassified Ciceribacter]MBO3759317.1 cytochrome c [Ciceribacter sp. L1K22]MBR0556440.1 cytochrome c [Ciceribacter sp. L1K23]
MKLKLVFAAATALCLGIGAAIAADEPQVVRQEMMKKVGGAMGAIGAIAKGEKPFDAEVIKASLETMAEVGKTFPDQFPAGSETGMDSEAAPAIWANMEDFKAKAAALVTAAEGQLAQLPTDQAGVGAVMKAVGSTCGACHETYRLKK